jgi:hypothetical protein
MKTKSKYLTFLVASGLLTHSQSQASAPNRFPSFAYQKGNAVFPDMTAIHHRLIFDVSRSSAKAVTEMEFTLEEEGFPVFDLVPSPTRVTLDGVETSAPATNTPSKETILRVVNRVAAPGPHKITVEYTVSNGISFSGGVPQAGFWMSDLSDRRFLERYVASSFEYDSVAMTFDIEVLNGKRSPIFFTNGSTQDLGGNRFRIEFPEYFNVSSVFFHMADPKAFKAERFDFMRSDGTNLPVTVYGRTSTSLTATVTKTKSVLTELDRDYGPFLHPSLTVYLAPEMKGGMEYNGGTITNLGALGHEITHSYFGRGLMPANGNAGWIDESLASWRDGGYRTKTTFSSSTNMAAHSTYTRITDRAAYSTGSEFMSHLNSLSKNAGLTNGLKTALRGLLGKYIFNPWTADQFQRGLEEETGLSLQKIFDQAVRRKTSSKMSANESPFQWFWMKAPQMPEVTSEHYHPVITEELIQSLL